MVDLEQEAPIKVHYRLQQGEVECWNCTPCSARLDGKKSQDSHHLSGSYNPLSEFWLEPVVPNARFQGLYVKPLHS